MKERLEWENRKWFRLTMENGKLVETPCTWQEAYKDFYDRREAIAVIDKKRDEVTK